MVSFFPGILEGCVISWRDGLDYEWENPCWPAGSVYLSFCLSVCLSPFFSTSYVAVCVNALVGMKTSSTLEYYSVPNKRTHSNKHTPSQIFGKKVRTHP